jgi:DNA-binding transcriptional MerR regulator
MPAIAPVKISGLAELSGIDVDTIRQYHAFGLLPEPRRRRSWTGDVAYHQEHLDRLVFIRRALEVGFELKAIGELIRLRDGLSTAGDVYEVASRQLERLRAELGRLQTIESEIARLTGMCPRQGSRKDCPILGELTAGAVR